MTILGTAFPPSIPLQSAGNSGVEARVSFVLEVCLTAKPTHAEVAFVKAMFVPQAMVLLIPRTRALFAATTSIDVFLDSHRGSVLRPVTWRELLRTVENSEGGKRIRVELEADSDASFGSPIRVDVMLVYDRVGTEELFVACTFVYDEEPNSSTPLTLY